VERPGRPPGQWSSQSEFSLASAKPDEEEQEDCEPEITKTWKLSVLLLDPEEFEPTKNKDDVEGFYPDPPKKAEGQSHERKSAKMPGPPIPIGSDPLLILITDTLKSRRTCDDGSVVEDQEITYTLLVIIWVPHGAERGPWAQQMVEYLKDNYSFAWQNSTLVFIGHNDTSD
jgi:hypothetical protein